MEKLQIGGNNWIAWLILLIVVVVAVVLVARKTKETVVLTDGQGTILKGEIQKTFSLNKQA